MRRTTNSTDDWILLVEGIEQAKVQEALDLALDSSSKNAVMRHGPAVYRLQVTMRSED